MAPKYSLGLDEFASTAPNNLWRSIVAEFVGIFILNFFSCAACSQSNGDLTLISLAFGLSVFAAASTIGHISGCHINPAVTFGMLAVGKVSVVRALFYVGAQCAGAVAAVLSLKVLTEGSKAVGLGHTSLSEGVDPLQGLGIEFFLGFVLVFIVCGVCDENKPDSRYLAPLAIGLTVTLGHLAVVSFTGSSMNPARTFGTAFVTDNWSNHWVYWLGPILGGCFASLLYTIVFAAPKQEETEKYRVVQQSEEKEMRMRP